MKNQIGWINFLKGLAILAVIIDHLFNVIYYDRESQLFTVFSVTLFIFLAGVTSVISLEHNKKPLKEYQLKRLKGLLVPYIIATIIYGIVNLNFHFNLAYFWNDLILFKASPPFYFVLFFCQLTFVAPFLYRVLAKKNLVFQFLSLVPIYFISKYLTHYTEISGIYGGGGKILGGSYLFVFYLGMFSFLLYQEYSGNINRLWFHLIGIIVSIALIYGINVSGWLAIGWSNPPNKQTILYTLSILLLGYSIFMIFTKWKFTRIFTSAFEVMGRYSLYIFLYHKLAIYYASKGLEMFGTLDDGIIKSVWFISFAIIIPLTIGVITKYRSRTKINETLSKWIVSRPKDGLDI